MAAAAAQVRDVVVPPDWPGSDAGDVVHASGIDWYLQRHGVTGPVIVLVHGAGASLHSWQGLWPLLRSRHQVIAVDLPGHGFSSPVSGAYTLERTAQALGELLVTLGAEPELVVGHSAGAAIAMQWALMQAAPRTTIAAINPALLPFNGLAGITFPVLARMMANMPLLATLIAARGRSRSGVERLIASTGSRISSRQLDGYHYLMQSPGHIKSVLGMMASWRLDGLLDRWRQRPSQLFVLLGLLDRAVPPLRTQRALQDMPATRIEQLISRGHLAHEESPQQIVDWLRTSGLVQA